MDGYNSCSAASSSCDEQTSSLKISKSNGILNETQFINTTINNNNNNSHYHHNSSSIKKPRLVFTDIQRRTLQAIFKETKRPSKEMQVTIAQQLGLEVATVSNFFMNARRRSMDKWKDQQDEDNNSNNNNNNNNNNNTNSNETTKLLFNGSGLMTNYNNTTIMDTNSNSCNFK